MPHMVKATDFNGAAPFVHILASSSGKTLKVETTIYLLHVGNIFVVSSRQEEGGMKNETFPNLASAVEYYNSI